MNRTALGYDLARGGVPAIDPVDPVNRFHPLNANRSSWWAMPPGQDGGPFLYDAAGVLPMTLNALATGEGWAPSTRPGSLGHALTLSGTGYATAPVPLPGPSFSIACWARTTAIGAGLLGWNALPDGTSTTGDRALTITSGVPTFYCYSGGTHYVTGPSATNDGKWHRYRGVLDSSGTMRLYVDGQSVGTPIAIGAGVSYAGNLVIGRFTSEVNLVGSIEDIVYDAAWPAGAASDALAWLDYQEGRAGYPGALNRIAPLAGATSPPPPPGGPTFFTDSLMSGGFSSMAGF